MFTVLLDAPGEPVKRIQVAKLGDFNDKRYGDFSITADNVANWQKHLSALPGGEALIDFEHRSERAPRDSKAAGWITGLELDGDKVMADVRWTPLGEDAVRNQVYRFMSPVYGDMDTETGDTLPDVFQSAALTNKPFLGLPAVTLASAERVSAALDEDPAARFYARALDGDLGDHTRALVMLDVSQAERDQAAKDDHALPDGSYPIRNAGELHAAAVLAASGHGDVPAARKLIRRRAKDLGVDVTTLPGFASGASDSRRAMDKAILTALGLDADNDLVTALASVELDEGAQRKLLDAAQGLKVKAETAPTPEPPKTLEAQAAESGKVLLDASHWEKLNRQAAAGEAASKQLHEQRFDHAFKAALDARKVAPAERDQLAHFFTLDADATIKLLEAREPIVPEKPSGQPVMELDQNATPEQLARAGLHHSGHDVDRLIKSKLLEKGLPDSDYPKLLDQYVTQGRL